MTEQQPTPRQVEMAAAALEAEVQWTYYDGYRVWLDGPGSLRDRLQAADAAGLINAEPYDAPLLALAAAGEALGLTPRWRVMPADEAAEVEPLVRQMALDAVHVARKCRESVHTSKNSQRFADDMARRWATLLRCLTGEEVPDRG